LAPGIISNAVGVSFNVAEEWNLVESEGGTVWSCCTNTLTIIGRENIGMDAKKAHNDVHILPIARCFKKDSNFWKYWKCI